MPAHRCDESFERLEEEKARESSNASRSRPVSTEIARVVVISNRLGLHARPAMLFVETANQFNASVTVSRTDQGEDAERVDGKSIMQMMMLAATCGTELRIQAVGDDANKAIEELVALVESGFSEE